MTATDAIKTRERPTVRRAISSALPRPVVAQRRRRRHESRWLAVLPPLIVGLLLLAFWDLLVRSGSVEEYLLPAPVDVADRFWSALTDGLLLRYARMTVQESLVGFLVGAAIAVPVGYGIARSALLARSLEPYLAASQAIPAVALAPLLVIWLGYGLKSVVVLCALIVFFPAVVNTTLGIRTLDREVLDAARVDGAGGWPMLIHFELPLALPAILAGLRTSLTLSVTGAVVGEFVLGDQGLGGLLTIARGNFDTPLVFATLLMLMLLAAALYGAARLAERALIRWLVE
jgi:NitT/TauT family transport system permease protein